MKNTRYSFSLNENPKPYTELWCSIKYTKNSNEQITQKYEILGKIAEGKYGITYKAIDRSVGNFLCIKKSKNNMNGLIFEANILKNLKSINISEQCPYICRYYDHGYNDNSAYLAMEYINGQTLLNYIIENEVDEAQCKDIFYKIVLGMEFIHSRKIIHRDIKLDNIVMKNNSIPVIVDFGSATYWNNDSRLNKFCGTVYYSSPEVLSQSNYIGPEVDVWSMGVLLYTMVHGDFPYHGNVRSIYQQIQKEPIVYDINLSVWLRDLLENLLKVQANERISHEKIKNHAWFSDQCQTQSDDDFSSLKTKSGSTLPRTIITSNPEKKSDIEKKKTIMEKIKHLFKPN